MEGSVQGTTSHEVKPSDRVRLKPYGGTGIVLRLYGTRRSRRAVIAWDTGGQSAPFVEDLEVSDV